MNDGRELMGAVTSRGRWGPVLLVVLAVALLAPAGAVAQDAISELTVIHGGSSSIQPPSGYTKINVDLNQGAGGDYVYACYKRGVGAPITGLAVTLNSAAPPAGVAWTRIDVDLNVTVGGDFIWLWYAKDPACSVLRDLTVLVGSTAATPPGYTKINVDLNRNADGAYLYFAYLLD